MVRTNNIAMALEALILGQKREQMFYPDGAGGGSGPELHETQPLRGQRGVITGTSRGIGQASAIAFAEFGSDIIGSHVDPRKATRQEGTAAQIRAFGTSFDSVIADVTEHDDRLALLHKAVGNPRHPNKIDYLVLNAAGGMERGKPEDWPQTFNVDSQHALVDTFLPYINEGGKIIYVTSLWAHDYGNLRQLPAYGPVASTKNQIERELRERQDEFAERGIKLGIVVGHVVRGTGPFEMFNRFAKEELAELEKLAEGGRFPEAQEMAHAIRSMLASGFESGRTEYVGGTKAFPIELPQGAMNREELQGLLPMYGDRTLLLDTFERTGVGEGTGSYTVRDQDTEQHFTGPFEKLKLFRFVDELELLAQLSGVTLLLTEGDKRALGVFRGVRGGIKNENPAKPGMRLKARTQIVQRLAHGAIANAEITYNGHPVFSAEGIELGILPDETTANRMIASKFGELERPASAEEA